MSSLSLILTPPLPLAALSLDPNAPEWNGIEPLEIATPAGPPPHGETTCFPRVTVRLRATPDAFYLLFCVRDEEGVQAIEHTPNGSVWLDSTVEFFVRPPHSTPYLNLEINCLGIPHASVVADWRRDPETHAVRNRTFLSEELLARIPIAHSIASLPTTRDGLPGKTSWALAYCLPYSVLSDAFGTPIAATPGSLWHANFYKCADASALPHWLSWSPMPHLNFHDPDHFGDLLLAPSHP